MKQVLLWLIRGYKKTELLRGNIARSLHLTTPACRFSPTCSEYTYQAIEEYGVVKGVTLGIKRILTCNPLFRK